MHLTLCYLFIYICARGRWGYVRARWSSLAGTGLRGQVRSSATTDDAYLQAFALKYGTKVYKGARRQVDVVGKTASLRALLYSVMQDREVTQKEAEDLRRELERVRRTAATGASSLRVVESSQSDLEDRLAAAVRRAEEEQRELEDRETALRAAIDRATELQRQVDSVSGERDQLRIRAETAEARMTEVTRELATLRVQGSSVDQKELARLRLTCKCSRPSREDYRR
ncbi:hypothetical protein Taro_006389 [Colocasia esculenta]|uniref:Uncharacterized protein n=1 Tax=Colocasia esculenta TaxID=4460 RepID=A0A843TSB1_COLES|nr:hypothetical protein [Colocasia esculenta]